MDGATARQWIAYAARLPLEVVDGLGLPDEVAIVIARGLEANRLLNPPAVGVKLGVFVCRYCGRQFVREWTTRPFRYCSPSHRTAAWRRRRRTDVRSTPPPGGALLGI